MTSALSPDTSREPALRSGGRCSRSRSARTVGPAVCGPAVQTIGDDHILVDVERLGNTLGEHIGDVVIGVGAVMKYGPERPLPFLGLQHAVGVGRVEKETFKVQFAQVA